MSHHDLALLAVQLAMGFSLAATTGLRAFLPIFAAGLLAHLGYVQVGPGYLWMQSTPALCVFGSAVLFELVGDKFPAVDHALDAAGLVIKPTAATLLAASLLTRQDPMTAAVLGLVAGGSVAGGVHLVKAKLRLASTVFTLGFANPILSVLEDGLALLGVAISILVPFAAAGVAAIALGYGIWRLTRPKKEKPAVVAAGLS
jgi:hypothetical protein